MKTANQSKGGAGVTDGRAVLDALKADLAVSQRRLGELLDISTATMGRRLRDGSFTSPELERLNRFQKIGDLAREALESEERAIEWLNAPNPALGGRIPLETARTEEGGQEVKDILLRIIYGVYS